jgi:hypothetical protein
VGGGVGFLYQYENPMEIKILYHKSYFFTVGSQQYAVINDFDSRFLRKKLKKVAIFIKN